MAKVRRQLRNQVQALQAGNEPDQPAITYEGVIPTYGGDTMLRIPLQRGRDDDAVRKEVARKVADIYMSADHLQGAARKKSIIEALKHYEASWQ